MKTFGGISRKSDKNYHEAHWVFHSNLMTCPALAQVNFSLGEPAFQNNKNELRKPYKHCRLRRLLAAFREKLTKSAMKSIRFSTQT